MLIRCTIGDVAQPATKLAGAGEDPRRAGATRPRVDPVEKGMLDMTGHIMKTLLNIMVALSLGAFMILFIVL